MAVCANTQIACVRLLGRRILNLHILRTHLSAGLSCLCRCPLRRFVTVAGGSLLRSPPLSAFTSPPPLVQSVQLGWPGRGVGDPGSAIGGGGARRGETRRRVHRAFKVRSSEEKIARVRRRHVEYVHGAPWIACAWVLAAVRDPRLREFACILGHS